MILLVIFETSPIRSHTAVVETLCRERGDGCLQVQDSVWLLDTDEQPRWWRDRLREHGDVGDLIFVSRLQQRWAALEMDDAATWLTESDRRW